MTRSVIYTNKAAKQLRSLPVHVAKAINIKVMQFAADPATLANNVTRMQGLPFSRLRVGDYRVIFTDDMEIVEVVRVGHRREVYD